MVSKKKTKWKGFIDEKDVDPDTLQKIRRYYEVYNATEDSGPGSDNHFNGHRAAEKEVPLTLAEQDIMRRLDPFGTIKGHFRKGA